MRTDKILVVDDEYANRLLLESSIEILGYECESASSGQEALSMLNEGIDLVLLDVNMPVLTGFDVVKSIRASSNCRDVPVIMVTALSSMQDRLAAVESGANDFISKPVEQTELRIRVAAQLSVKHAQDLIKRQRHNLEVQVQERTAALEEANGELARLATMDPVTGLPNYRSLIEALDREIARCTTENTNCSVLFIDLDYFKALNDSHGHLVGDSVLKELGMLLQQACISSGTCGRWGGEEFLCILPNQNEIEAVEHAEQLRRLVANHQFKVGIGCHLTCSIGVATYPGDGNSRALLAAAADKAMYVAKALGRNQVQAARDIDSGFEGLQSASTREDQALVGLVEALAALVNMRDQSTGLQLNQIEGLAAQIGAEMGLTESECRLVGIAGKLHDLGKVTVPDSILTKTGLLTPEEWEIVKQHPAVGAEVLARVPSLRAVAPAVRAHHERWDGTGYPEGLKGAEIPLSGQIVAVANAYYSMMTDRPYRKAETPEFAIAEMRRFAGTQFSPEVVAALERVCAKSTSFIAA